MPRNGSHEIVYLTKPIGLFLTISSLLSSECPATTFEFRHGASW